VGLGLTSPIFFDCVEPQLQREIFSLWVAQVRSQLVLIALLQLVSIERNSSRKVLNVISVALRISLKF